MALENALENGGELTPTINAVMIFRSRRLKIVAQRWKQKRPRTCQSTLFRACAQRPPLQSALPYSYMIILLPSQRHRDPPSASSQSKEGFTSNLPCSKPRCLRYRVGLCSASLGGDLMKRQIATIRFIAEPQKDRRARSKWRTLPLRSK